MNHPPCSVDDCGRDGIKRGMCEVHYMRWYRKAMRDGTFVRVQRRSDSIPPEEGVEEFEMLMQHTTDMLLACRRLGVHPRTVIRWHKRAGKPVPQGLWQAYNVASTRVA